MKPPASTSITRVLLVCEPGKDGAFEHAADLARHILSSKPGVIVDLAYSSRRATAALDRLVEKIRSHGGEAVDLHIANAPEIGDVAALRSILQLVRRNKTQIVHSHSSKAGVLCRALAVIWPQFPPVLYTPNAYYGMTPGRGGLASLFFNGIEQIAGHIGTTINVSTDELRFAREKLRLSPRKLVLIYNGVDTQRFQPATREEKAALRRELGLPEKSRLLISVGRDANQKNYTPLYRALDSVLSEPRHDLFFAHAGAGSTKLGQTLSPASQTRFKSFEHLATVEKLFRAADAFLLTSRYEGLSLAVLQALSCGLKTFLTRVPGNRCFATMGFDEISWIDYNPDTNALAETTLAVIHHWLPHVAVASPRQREHVVRLVDSSKQFDKIFKLYERLGA